MTTDVRREERPPRTRRWILLAALLVLLALAGGAVWRFVRANVNVGGVLGEGAVAELQTPPGFAISVFASGLEGPRLMAFSPDGVLHVAERAGGRVVALEDRDGDGRAEEPRVVAAELDQPHSLAWREGHWYVGVPNGIQRLDDLDGDGVAESRTAIVDDVPAGGFHRTRTVLFLPDGRMLLSVGSSCNVCVEEDPRRAAILVYPGPEGGEAALFATGLRNAVGLALRPGSDELWATNNGRDLLGDDQPPETVNRVREGEDFGWPHCINGHTEDPDAGFPGACADVAAPAVEYQAHSAPLGLAFYEGEAFPDALHGDLFVANHGSWNRSVPTGYDVIRLPFHDGLSTGEVEPFVTGWLRADGSAAGRPVGVTTGPDGALYISDDKAGLVYVLRWVGTDPS